MPSHRNTVRFQARQHEFVATDSFHSVEEYVLYLIHLKAYETAADLAKNHKVLDLGCNTGYGAKVLREHTANVVAVDVSARAIGEAQQRFGHFDIDFRIVDGIELPFDDGSFDLITSFQVVEHIADTDVYLSEIKRVLAPHGRAIFTTPNAALRLDDDMQPWNPFHVREFKPTGLSHLLGRYFPSVQVQGLFATDDLYTVESQRLARAREQARRRPAWLGSLRWQASRWLPFEVLMLLMNVDRWIRKPAAASLSVPALMKMYSTQDLFYRDEALDKALDLMAICRTASP
jgi:2-polyprenyl-3-methyl-5-hydroxy-6-metoxy-1,4-benzoquinol methylase